MENTPFADDFPWETMGFPAKVADVVPIRALLSHDFIHMFANHLKTRFLLSEFEHLWNLNITHLLRKVQTIALFLLETRHVLPKTDILQSYPLEF